MESAERAVEPSLARQAFAWRANFVNLLARTGRAVGDASRCLAHRAADRVGQRNSTADDGKADNDKEEGVFGRRSAGFVLNELVKELSHVANPKFNAQRHWPSGDMVSIKAPASISGWPSPRGINRLAPI